MKLPDQARRQVVRVGMLWMALGAFANLAHADGWSGFAAAFPLFPCQDGWMGCVVYEQHVDPELRRDTAGRAIPSDSRIGWFDLEATPTFSPFTGLSRYEPGPLVVASGGEPDGIADADPGPSVRPVEDEGARLAREAARQRAKDDEAARVAANRVAQKQRDDEAAARRAADEAARRAASAGEQEKAQLDREAKAAAAKAAEVEKSRKAAEIAAAAKQAEADKSRMAAEAAAEKARLEALRNAEVAEQALKEEERRRAAEAAAAANQPGGPAGDCVDLAKLEPFASLGKLGPDIEKCLESRLVNAPKMTDKKKISGILMADAWAKNDKERWETLIKRHLDVIDQSDPDLCYKYALHLSRQGAGRASGVIRWSNVALENRMVWIGEQYASRVFSLYKVRAAASQALWQAAESDYASAPGEEAKEKLEKYRNMTKVNAREWYEYAKASGKDASTALQLCMSAAGTADYCEAQ